jgi:hypothetical protein
LRIGQGVGAQFWDKFTRWMYEHVYLFVGAGLAVFLLGARRAEPMIGELRPTSSRIVRVLLLVVGAHIAVVAAMTEAVFLYVVVITPLLTLLAGIGFDATVAWWRQRSQLSQVRGQRASRLMLAGGVVVLVLTAGGWEAARSHRERVDDRHYSFWPHVLHGQVSRLQQLDAALHGIESMLPKDGTIFGDPTIVSAVALHSGRRVSAELADLNPGWIEAGTVKREDVITPPYGLVQDPYLKSYLLACYEQPKPVFPPESGPGEGLPFFLVFSHIQGVGPCHVPSL